MPTFRSLVEHVARLAYANRDDLLFFRGQNKDYQSKSGGTTLYPSIYREDSLPTRELRHRFDMLEEAGRILVERFKAAGIVGHTDLRQKRYIQWGILQHYEVLPTPFLDITQSLRVACSFAQLAASGEGECYVYVFGLPYITNRISINSEHDLVNVRLLSICPPSALRPYFQEGFLAATSDVTWDFDSKTELDFRNRLVAKFSIPTSKKFWGSGFNQIPQTALYPRGDNILELCVGLRDELRYESRSGDIGDFVKEWASVEQYLLNSARQLASRNLSVREAIRALEERGMISKSDAQELDILRSQRNTLIHRPELTSRIDAEKSLLALRALSRKLLR